MAIIEGALSGNKQEVDSNNNAYIKSPGYNENGQEVGGGNDNANANFSENDPGTKTGARYTLSPETSDDFRLRIENSNILDEEKFNYGAQNTGKHQINVTTQTITYSAAGMLTNASAITTTNTGNSFRTYAMFPMFGSGQVLYAQFQASFNILPVANSSIDFGLFQQPLTTPYAPTDGCYFRQDSTGFKAVINNNGTELETALSAFTYVANTVYRFVISISDASICFWINDVLYAKVTTPIGQGSPFLSTALPIGVRQAFVGAAGGAIQMLLKDYSLSTGGTQFSDALGVVSNRVYGTYQGLSGGTMGSLASYANNANPTAAVPTNTTSTVLTALGGQGWETDTLAVTTDGIIMSYQVPAGTVAIQGKRLKVVGFKMSSYIQTTLTGGGYNAQFALCFGHTAVSLATGEAATTKAPRRIALGSYSVAANAAALTQLPDLTIDLSSAPIYVNPGEFFAVAKKKVGTAPSAGVVAYAFTPIYAWE